MCGAGNLSGIDLEWQGGQIIISNKNLSSNNILLMIKYAKCCCCTNVIIKFLLASNVENDLVTIQPTFDNSNGHFFISNMNYAHRFSLHRLDYFAADFTKYFCFRYCDIFVICGNNFVFNKVILCANDCKKYIN